MPEIGIITPVFSSVMRFEGMILLLVLGLLGCKKKQLSAVDVYGHAGNGLKTQHSPYYHNTLESIELALGTEGVTGVEIDVQLSADGDLWVFHDDYLQDETDGTGCINEQTSAELEGIRYTSLHKEKLIRLSDLHFELYTGRTILIDARHYNACSALAVDGTTYTQRLADIRDAAPGVSFIVLTRYKDWIPAFKSLNFTVLFEYEQRSELELLAQAGITIDGVVIRNNGITADEIKEFHANGKQVILFDIRAPKTTRRAMKKLPDGVIVDDIKTALIEKS